MATGQAWCMMGLVEGYSENRDRVNMEVIRIVMESWHC